MLNYINNTLHFDKISLLDIAKQFSTPSYIYSADSIKYNYLQYTKNAGKNTSIHYAVKANSNLSILKLLYNLGAGFDIVSIGELQRVLKAANDCSKVIFSGVGKTIEEIEFAIKCNIMCFNVESIAELYTIQAIANKLNKKAHISLRINPDVDAKTHPYISTGLKNNKFGIAFNQALNAYKLAQTMPNLDIIGIDCHIGSQILTTVPFFEALNKLLELIEELKHNNINIQHIDIGGGIGVDYYENEQINLPNISEFVANIQTVLANKGYDHLHLIFEPGRSMIANAGILLTKIEYLKPSESKNFCIVDAAMNDLTRPAMYDAYHAVWQVSCNLDTKTTYDIVGPVCESGDWLAKDRQLAVKQGEYLAILSAGSYGFTMSSNYNTRARAAEVLIENRQARLIRKREKIQDLFALEIEYI